MVRVVSVCVEILSIFVGRMNPKQTGYGKDELLSCGIHLTREGYGMLSFIYSITRLSGCCFACHTHCQTATLSNSVSDTQPYRTPFTPSVFLYVKEGMMLYVRVQDRVS